MKTNKKLIIISSIILILLTVVFAILMNRNINKDNDNDSSKAEFIAREKTPSNAVPTYIPKSIELIDINMLSDEFGLPNTIKHRLCYYLIPQFLTYLVDSTDIDKFFEEFTSNYNLNDEPKSMMLKELIIKFRIPKDRFVELLNEDIRISQELLEIDLSEESEELPNADIIYTFDDKIISEYYRRE